ncbi:MAG: methylated-DNA--[protein]-cysteine S-methyltransferase [Chloroflexota bacterium]|nr:methylated-DNA--[protein]-cysteine S-methyltransferase [Chloroflexota bacterium]
MIVTATALPARTDLLPAGLLVHWGQLPTALGPVFVAASPEGVIQVSTTEGTADAFVAHLDAELGGQAHLIADPNPLLTTALDQLAAFFAGTGRTFDVPLDWRLLQATAFYRSVLEAMGDVPWGHLVSYGELARRVGSPRAARAVGHACSLNPLPILIPCHRVVYAGGGIGGYGAPGIAYKRALLAIEGVVFADGR